MDVTFNTGKDVKDTDMLKGYAEKTKSESAQNTASQYETGSTAMGKLGGEATGQ